jgi:hypothetical protein
VSPRGYPTEQFRDSLDIRVGKRGQLRAGAVFPLSGAGAGQFYETNGFTWLDEVEDATVDIRAKLIKTLKDQSRFTRYVTGDPRKAARRPVTLNALAGVQLARVKTARLRSKRPLEDR